jgi:hypothetical protein
VNQSPQQAQAYFQLQQTFFIATLGRLVCVKLAQRIHGLPFPLEAPLTPCFSAGTYACDGCELRELPCVSSGFSLRSQLGNFLQPKDRTSSGYDVKTTRSESSQLVLETMLLIRI